MSKVTLIVNDEVKYENFPFKYGLIMLEGDTEGGEIDYIGEFKGVEMANSILSCLFSILDKNPVMEQTLMDELKKRKKMQEGQDA